MSAARSKATSNIFQEEVLGTENFEHYRRWVCYTVTTLKDNVWEVEGRNGVAYRFWTWKMANDWAWNNVDEPIYEVQTEVLNYDLETRQWR